MNTKTRSSGFGGMQAEKQREIARKGGMAAHVKGTAHEFTTQEARDAGRKGGQQVSANRGHMAEIGRLGGKRSAERRQLMSQDSPDGPSPSTFASPAVMRSIAAEDSPAAAKQEKPDSLRVGFSGNDRQPDTSAAASEKGLIKVPAESTGQV